MFVRDPDHFVKAMLGDDTSRSHAEECAAKIKSLSTRLHSELLPAFRLARSQALPCTSLITWIRVPRARRLSAVRFPAVRSADGVDAMAIKRRPVRCA